MMKMYVYDVDSNEVVATINAENNEACEQTAQDNGYGDTDYYGWSYNDNGLEYTQDSVEIDG